jgi:HAD superfamily hydrolase (TIGR01549 family)
MTKLKLIIFDCDGVMFDSIEANRQYYNHILGAFGHPEMDEEELQFVHVHHVFDSVRHIFRKYPSDYEKADLYRQKLDYSPYLQYMRIEPDLVEFLEYLRPTCKAAISTNRSTTMPDLLRIFKLESYFDQVVTALDVEHSKPHPEALFKILNHLHMSADQAIYIGDSHIDQEHAASAGMRLIAFKNPALEADYHVTSFMEIPQLGIF